MCFFFLELLCTFIGSWRKVVKGTNVFEDSPKYMRGISGVGAKGGLCNNKGSISGRVRTGSLCNLSHQLQQEGLSVPRFVFEETTILSRFLFLLTENLLAVTVQSSHCTDFFLTLGLSLHWVSHSTGSLLIAKPVFSAGVASVVAMTVTSRIIIQR